MFNSLRNIGYCKRWVEVQNRDIKFPKCLWHRLQFDDLDMNDELGPWWINASSKKSHHASRKLQLISTQDWASLWSQGLAGVGMQASWYENYQWLPLVFAIPLVAGTAVFTALVVSWSLPLSNVWKLGNSHRSSIVEIRSRGDNKWFCNNRLPGLPSSLKSQRVFQAFQASNFPILSTLRLHHFASRQSKTEGGPVADEKWGSAHCIHKHILDTTWQVCLHPESPLGEITLECYNCGREPQNVESMIQWLPRQCDTSWEGSPVCGILPNSSIHPQGQRNVFLLGFIAAKSDSVVVLCTSQMKYDFRNFAENNLLKTQWVSKHEPGLPLWGNGGVCFSEDPPYLGIEALPSLSLQQCIEGLKKWMRSKLKSPTGNLFPSTKARKLWFFGCMNSIWANWKDSNWDLGQWQPLIEEIRNEKVDFDGCLHHTCFSRKRRYVQML